MTAKRRPPAGRAARRAGGRRPPTLIDRILDFPYRRLFGRTGRLVIAGVVLVLLAVKFVTGIDTVGLDPATCELAWADKVYQPFFKARILANSRRDLSQQLADKQATLWQIKAGRNPFPSDSGGNVARVRTINPDKFFWRSYASNLESEIAAISDCLRRLPTYRFD